MKTVFPLILLILSACAPVRETFPNFYAQEVELNQLVVNLRIRLDLPGSVDTIPVMWGQLSPPYQGWATKGVAIIVHTDLRGTEMLKRVVLHEMGHQFGLEHNNEPCHIMHFTHTACHVSLDTGIKQIRE